MKHLSVLIVVLLFADDVKFLILFCLSIGDGAMGAMGAMGK